MFFHRKPGWKLSESQATDEQVYIKRRSLLKMLGLPMLFGASVLSSREKATAQPAGTAASAGSGRGVDYRQVPTNERYTLETVGRPLTSEAFATTYNNFYEFGSQKNIWRQAQALELRPWTVTIDGMVEQPRQIDIDDLVRQMSLEERVYRLRCVEAWSMVIPWIGFPLRDLVEFARPLGSARYLQMQTFLNPDVAPGQRQVWYPWPYQEALRLDEATNELAFIATGIYGKPSPPQNGAPIRLVVPWKYGFKSIKSVVRFTFTERQPTTFWEEINSREYGFWANVNPEVDHPRWSQASERLLESRQRIPTLLYNGYGEYVAHLYRGMESQGDRLFR